LTLLSASAIISSKEKVDQNRFIESHFAERHFVESRFIESHRAKDRLKRKEKKLIFADQR
jgi:hypothetical protein